MTDIVERLRDADTTRRIGESYADTHERRQRDRNEAADEIERLRADLRLAVMSDSETCKVLEREVERLLKSRNRWAKKYNDLLAKRRTEGGQP